METKFKVSCRFSTRDSNDKSYREKLSKIGFTIKLYDLPSTQWFIQCSGSLGWNSIMDLIRFVEETEKYGRNLAGKISILSQDQKKKIITESIDDLIVLMQDGYGFNGKITIGDDHEIIIYV